MQHFFSAFRDVREKSVLISTRGVKALENLFSFAFPSFAPFSTSRRYIIHTRNGTRERCRVKNCFCVWINISKDLTHPTFLFPALTRRRRAPNIKRCELVSEMFKKKLQFTSIQSWVRNFPPRLDSKGLTLHSLFPSSDWSSPIIFALILHSISEHFSERKKNCLQSLLLLLKIYISHEQFSQLRELHEIGSNACVESVAS